MFTYSSRRSEVSELLQEVELEHSLRKDLEMCISGSEDGKIR